MIVIVIILLLILMLQYCSSFSIINYKTLSSSSSLLSLSHSSSISNRIQCNSYNHCTRLFATNTKLNTKSSINNTSSNSNSNSNSLIENNDNGNFDSITEKGIILVLAIAALSLSYGIFSGNINFVKIIESSIDRVAELGPVGYLYFAAVYIVAEVLAIPAFPLTASSGYLFGLIPGTAIVLISATVAATISFYLGRTFLKGWAQNYTSKWSQWVAIDKAIAKEGFKVILLLRLSPLLPFALSNYLYGITSIDFLSFIAGTFLGFAPGTFGLVYAGTAGKDLMSAAGENLPWYAYAVGGGIILLLGKVIAQVASDAIKELEETEQTEQ